MRNDHAGHLWLIATAADRQAKTNDAEKCVSKRSNWNSLAEVKTELNATVAEGKKKLFFRGCKISSAFSFAGSGPQLEGSKKQNRLQPFEIRERISKLPDSIFRDRWR